MSYNQFNLNVIKAAPTKSVKHALNTVAFYGNRTIATNSFSLVEVSADGTAHDPILIPVSLLKAVKLPKGMTYQHVDQIGIKPMEGENYPDVDQVTKSEYAREGDRSITVNSVYLREILNALQGMNKFECVTLSIPEVEGRGMVIRTESKDGQTGKAILMPINKR